MFKDTTDERKYIVENFRDITQSHISDELWDLSCDSEKCGGVVRGFHVTRKGYTTNLTIYRSQKDLYGARTAILRCPACSMYKVLIYFSFPSDGDDRFYQALELPSEITADVTMLPENPASLRLAYVEAIKSMNAGAYVAAATMFRRALQVITRDIGKAKRGNLASELKGLVGRQVNGVTFTQNFSNIGYIIKEGANQAAHPDEDPDLLTFTLQDAQDLHAIFNSLVAEIFVAPKAAQQAKERFLANRKIDLPQDQINSEAPV